MYLLIHFRFTCSRIELSKVLFSKLRRKTLLGLSRQFREWFDLDAFESNILRSR